MNTIDSKVVIRCFTFNHAPYILQTLDGFCMQQTNFPYTCCIIDDFSTDGEQAIIQEYFSLHFDNAEMLRWETDDAVYMVSHHKTNQNCHFVVILLKYNHYSQGKAKKHYLDDWRATVTYEAVCEGDDYWTDELKLQKQYDLMEAHPDCSLCFHSIMEIFEGHPELNKVRTNVENREYSGIEWYKIRPSQFASFFFRTEIYNTNLYREMKARKFPAGDIPLLLTCAHYGKIMGISDVMSVYRHNEGGWTCQKRTDEQMWKIVKSQHAYRMFGPDFEKPSDYFAQRDCVSYFLSNLKRGKLKWSFLTYSLRLGVSGTIRALWKVSTKQFD